MSSCSKVLPLTKKVAPATRMARLEGPLHLRRGGYLPVVDIAYETWGDLSAAKDNAVLVFTGLSPSAHAAASPDDPTPGWWDYMVGPGQPIDTNRYYVICVNSLGSCFGSTGPGSIDPRNGRRYRTNFPELTLEDIATAGREVVRALGISRLHTLVGCSLGGMTALAYAVQFVDALENLVLVSSAARALPSAIAVRSLQREIIRKDPAWKNGFYESCAGPVEGMRLARKLGLISYRSGVEWQMRFGRNPAEPAAKEPFGIQFEVEAYIEANARKFAENFDANSYLYLSRAMDWFDVTEHAHSFDAALAKVRARRTLVIGVETDSLFPLFQQREIADGLRRAGRNVKLLTLPSVQGHDAFLVDKQGFGPAIAGFFRES